MARLGKNDLGALDQYLTLQVGLWIAVLLAYFPATLQRRIPYMPIGLAGSLFIIEPSAGLIPWIVTLIMLPLPIGYLEGHSYLGCKHDHDRS